MKDNSDSRIDEGRRIDDLFRQGLQNLEPEPSRDLWKGINQRLWWDEISHFTFTNLSKIFLIGGIAGMMILITALMVLVIPETSGSEENNLSLLSGQVSAGSSLAIPVSMTSRHSVTANSGTSNDAVAVKDDLTANELTSDPVQASSKETELPSESISAPGPVTAHESHFSTVAMENTERPANLLSFMDPLSNENNLVTIEKSGPVVEPVMIQNIPKGKPPIPSFFSADLGVTPQVTLNSQNSATAEMTFSGDAGFQYHFGKFSIRSGVGINYMADDGVYQVEYKSKDSIGFYNQVVSYAVNPDDPTDVKYVLNTVTVYDSLQHIADDRTRNRYTYLQVPLLAGYRFLETSRLGLTLFAGPMVSFLVSEREAEPVINYPNARIIRIDNNTPARVKTNWQLWLSLRVDYKITKAFSLFAEPSYKYYLKPVVEGNEAPARNPYSIGLGVGIQYNFGRKITAQ